MKYIPVAGTHDWEPPELTHARWWQRSSRFTALMAEYGFERHGWEVLGQEIPSWSCGLAGTFFAGRDLRIWWRGGYTLAHQLMALPVLDRNIIAHSHGGNVAVLAAAIMDGWGEPMNRLITVCTPNRKDMTPYYESVWCPWRHIYSTEIVSNRMQWIGSRVRFKWEMPAADNYKAVGKIGHSELLRSPDDHIEDITRGIIDFLDRPLD